MKQRAEQNKMKNETKTKMRIEMISATSMTY